MCEDARIDLFLAAVKFNLDDVYGKTALYDTKEQLYTADILIHKTCLNRYLLNYKRDLDKATEVNDDMNE